MALCCRLHSSVTNFQSQNANAEHENALPFPTMLCRWPAALTGHCLSVMSPLPERLPVNISAVLYVCLCGADASLWVILEQKRVIVVHQVTDAQCGRLKTQRDTCCSPSSRQVTHRSAMEESAQLFHTPCVDLKTTW
ncbi:uncharacterized [Tachysurus ichikawai]